MNVAVILAGGVGSRVGAGIPKQFIEVLGKPIIAYTIEVFESYPDIDAILVTCIKPYIDYICELKEKYDYKKLAWVTEGGSTFQESVINSVNFLRGKIDKNDIVLIHFSASPFVTDDIITDVIRVCKEKENAISATDYLLLSGWKKKTAPVTDPENYSDEYINRETIAVMSSPHAFRYSYIDDLYKEAIETGIINQVGPHTTTLMYALKRKIYFAKGKQTNIKITTKEDIDFFEGYILKKQKDNGIITIY